MAAERSHLLVLGVRGSELGCPGTFASRLVGEVEEEEEQQPLLPWTLTTKYYRAELAVHVRHAELLEGRLAAHEVLASVAEEEGGPHGVVIVVDGRDGSGMQAWRPW